MEGWVLDRDSAVCVTFLPLCHVLPYFTYIHMYCCCSQEFLPNFYLTRSIHLHFPPKLSRVFPVLAVASAGPCVGPHNNIDHPCCSHRRLIQVSMLNGRRIFKMTVMHTKTLTKVDTFDRLAFLNKMRNDALSKKRSVFKDQRTEQVRKENEKYR